MLDSSQSLSSYLNSIGPRESIFLSPWCIYLFIRFQFQWSRRHIPCQVPILTMFPRLHFKISGASRGSRGPMSQSSIAGNSTRGYPNLDHPNVYITIHFESWKRFSFNPTVPIATISNRWQLILKSLPDPTTHNVNERLAAALNGSPHHSWPRSKKIPPRDGAFATKRPKVDKIVYK